jgi:hypothetical protein
MGGTNLYIPPDHRSLKDDGIEEIVVSDNLVNNTQNNTYDLTPFFVGPLNRAWPLIHRFSVVQE